MAAMATATQPREPPPAPESALRRSHFLAGLLGALVVALPIVGLAIGGAFDPPPPTAPAPPRRPPPSRRRRRRPPLPRAARPTSPRCTSASAPASSRSRSRPRRAAAPARASCWTARATSSPTTTSSTARRPSACASPRARLSNARVVGVDPSTDLALLKIDPAGRKLTPLALGSSKDLKVGQPAIAIGSPFRLEGHADDRRHLRARALDHRAEQLLDRQRRADRRRDQPRQLRRPAARRERPRRRHQRPDRDLDAVQQRRRLRDPDRHGQAGPRRS